MFSIPDDNTIHRQRLFDQDLDFPVRHSLVNSQRLLFRCLSDNNILVMITIIIIIIVIKNTILTSDFILCFVLYLNYIVFRRKQSYKK